MRFAGRLLIVVGIAIPLFVMVLNERQEIDDAIHIDRPAALIDGEALQSRNTIAVAVGVTVGTVGALVWVAGTIRQRKRRRNRSGED